MAKIQTSFSIYQHMRMVMHLTRWPLAVAGQQQSIIPLLTAAQLTKEEAESVSLETITDPTGLPSYTWNNQAAQGVTIERRWSRSQAKTLRNVVANPPQGIAPWVAAQHEIANDMLRQLGAAEHELFGYVNPSDQEDDEED